jgi:penicillin G amidase
VKTLDTFTLEYLQAYAEGVNAYEGSRPLELLIAGVEPEPWTPTDSVVLLKVFILCMCV